MTCSAPGEHRPRAHQTDTHHILPRSWGGPDVPANRVELCPNHHHNVHDLLNEYIRAGGLPAATVLRTFTKLEQQLADRAWSQRPSDHPPYTLTRPEEPVMAASAHQSTPAPSSPPGVGTPMWMDVLERGGWTFAQAFLSVAGAAGLGWVNAGVAKSAAIAGGAAVISFLKNLSVQATVRT